MDNKKSIKMNAVLNVIKTVLGIIFPLITFPYASRILGTSNYGIFTFSASIISYISLIAGLGINTYATREGATRRDNKNLLDEFINHIFTINILSTIFAYFVLFILIINWHQLESYRFLILILSIPVLFTTLGTDWINIIFEDYLYITKRYIVCQSVFVVMLFTVVKNTDHLLRYAVISVLGTVLTNTLNMFYIRKHLGIYPHFTISKLNDAIKNHLKPIIIIFASTIISVIYINSDITILGIIKDDYQVGIYGAASKIYNLIKQVLAAIVTVTIPRISLFVSKNMISDINIAINKVLEAEVIILFPVMTGIILISKFIILIIAGEDYIEAYIPLQILALSLIFSIFGYIFLNAILIPFKNEKIVLYISVFSALINIIFNLFLIPNWGYNAAAFTTLLSEAFVSILGFIKSKKYVEIEFVHSLLLGSCGSAVVFVCYKIVDVAFGQSIMGVFLIVISSVITYFILLMIDKNNICYNLMNSLVIRYKKSG